MLRPLLFIYQKSNLWLNDNLIDRKIMEKTMIQLMRQILFYFIDQLDETAQLDYL